jgi:hypothetical protein
MSKMSKMSKMSNPDAGISDLHKLFQTRTR